MFAYQDDDPDKEQDGAPEGDDSESKDEEE